VRQKEEVFRGRKGWFESFSNRAGWLNVTLEGGRYKYQHKSSEEHSRKVAETIG